MNATFSISKEEYERELEWSFHGGRASTTEEASDYLNKQAQQAFSLRLDDEAKLLRTLSDSLEKKGKEEREKQQEFKPV